jgi:hypothetical protein
MFLRKIISLSIIAIIFSSLSITISTSLTEQQLIGDETQVSIVDIDQSGLNEEFEIQDRTQEIKEEKVPPEIMDDNLSKNNTKTINKEENETSTKQENQKDNRSQNNTKKINQEENEILTEQEIQELDHGEIKAIGVNIFSGNSFNNSLSSIDWGTLEPGANKYIECYVQNTGKTEAILTLETDNWIPREATKYITLNWDYKGQKLKINEILSVTLILSISKNIQGISGFSFDIIIIGSTI